MKVKVNSKKGLIGIVIIAIILGIMLMALIINNKNSKSDKTLIEFLKQSLLLKEDEVYEKEEDDKDEEVPQIVERNNEEISILPTMLEEIKPNSIWCPTFQLIWNDMVNEVVKQEVVFNPQEEMVENLNKQEFKEEMISDELYYKTYGLKTIELKEKIEKGIKDKFNEKSSILDTINWADEDIKDTNDIEKYIFYSMLKREFKFENKFTTLETAPFGDKYKDIKYFGINSDTEDAVRNQVKVLYYNSDNDFAVEISTKQGDKLILSRGCEKNNFSDIYKEINQKAGAFEGDKEFLEKDNLKIPNIKINEKKEYEELENKPFIAKDGRTAEIADAIQTIEFELDSEGGKVKSEALMQVTFTSAIDTDKKAPRNFYFEDEFVIFIKEENKELPYLACKISDISLYQK